MNNSNPFNINNLQYIEKYLYSIDKKTGDFKVTNYFIVLIVPLFAVFTSVVIVAIQQDEDVWGSVIAWHLLSIIAVVLILFAFYGFYALFRNRHYRIDKEAKGLLIDNVKYAKLINEIVTSHSLIEAANEEKNKKIKNIYIYECIQHLDSYLRQISSRVIKNSKKTNLVDSIKLKRLSAGFFLSEEILQTLKESFPQQLKDMNQNTIEVNIAIIKKHISAKSNSAG